MSTLRAHIAALTSAALLSAVFGVLGVFAAPAAANGLLGGGSAGRSSVLLDDPLSGLDDPLNRLVPGDGNLGERLGDSLGGVPDVAAPESAATPEPASNGSIQVPKRSAPSTKIPAKRVIQPTGGTNSNGRAVRKSGDGPAGPSGARRVANSKQSVNREAIHHRSPKSPPAVTGPTPPNSFVGSVVDRIPPQYRWPVFVLACLAMLFAFTSLRERRRSLRVERAALVDSLTGLPNRQAFERRLAKEWRRSERYDRPLGLLLIDLDDFKQVNDTQGHAAGDAVLREVAAAISGRIRVSDMAARLGGDEFVVVCPETPLDGLKILALSLEERLQEASVAISVGYTEREPADEDPKHFVERADAAMYRRKQSTREHRRRRAGHRAAPATLVVAAAD